MTAQLRRGAFWRSLAAELGIVAFGGFVYALVREITEGSPAKAMANARELLELERALGIDVEQHVQALALENAWVRDAANWVYIWGHWPVIICVAAGLFVYHREHYTRLRNAIFASGLIAFAFFAFMPMAPPRLAQAGFVDTVTQWSSSYRVLQPPDYTNLYAAMPSLHFGWDLLVGLALVLSTNILVLRVIGIAMPTAMGFAVIATGNHWILDVVVGLVVVAAGVLVAEGLRARSIRRSRARARPAQAAAVGGRAVGVQERPSRSAVRETA